MSRVSMGCVLAVCVGCASTQPVPQAGSGGSGASADPIQGSATQAAGDETKTSALSEADARAIAEQKARDDGYDLAVFAVVAIARERGNDSAQDTWKVSFEHAPPTPPGGHFVVYVDAVTRAARLIPGR